MNLVKRMNSFTKFLLMLLYILLPLVAYSLGAQYQQGVELSLQQRLIQTVRSSSAQ